MDPQLFLIVLPLEAHPVGTRFRSLPLHCTLMHWFSFAGEPGVLIRALDQLGGKGATLTLTSAVRDHFGYDCTVPVHRVEKCRPLMDLHRQCFDQLVAISVVFNEPAWVGAGYNPPVTDKPGRKFTPGIQCQVDRFVLLEAMDGDYIRGDHQVVAEVCL